MSQSEDRDQSQLRSAVTFTVLGVAGGTLLVIFLALLFGILLDRLLNTRPWFTVGLMIASIPVSIVLIFQVVKAATSRLRPPAKKPNPVEEPPHGTDC